MDRIHKCLVLWVLLIPLLFLLGLHYLLLNTTSSMPVGLYLISYPKHFNRGDIVAAHLPLSMAKLAVQRNYLIAINEPVVKELIALPNDIVQVNQHALVVNDRNYPVKFLTVDLQQHNLPRLTKGTYRTTGYWLLGTNNPRSFDSRYFGAVDKPLYKLTPVLIYKNWVSGTGLLHAI